MRVNRRSNLDTTKPVAPREQRLCVGRLNPSREKQDDDNNQDDAKDADSAMTVAIAVAAEAATEPTKQRDDQDDDEDESERRHGAVLPPDAVKPDFLYIRFMASSSG